MIKPGEIREERRGFLKAVGMAVLSVHCLPLIAQAEENPPSGDKNTAGNLTIQSSPGTFSHVHDLLIPLVALQSPPAQGIKLTTTEAMFHRHEIVLTREQLTTVSRQGTVTQKGGSHLFTIALAKGQRRT